MACLIIFIDRPFKGLKKINLSLFLRMCVFVCVCTRARVCVESANFFLAHTKRTYNQGRLLKMCVRIRRRRGGRTFDDEHLCGTPANANHRGSGGGKKLTRAEPTVRLPLERFGKVLASCKLQIYFLVIRCRCGSGAITRIVFHASIA